MNLERLGSIFNSDDSERAEVIETKEERRARLLRDAEKYDRAYNETRGNLDTIDSYECKLCNNRGGFFRTKIVNGEPESYYEPCKCMQIRGMIDRLKKSGLKNIIKDYTFDKYIVTDEWQRKIKGIAQNFTQDEKATWFYVGGMTGIGKTHLCTAIAAHYLKQGKTVKYMLWRDDITDIKAKVTDSEEYSRAIRELKDAEVLYIDDLFKMGKDETLKPKRPTTSDINIAYEILNYRYINKHLITIISSERDILDILDIDEAIGGRLSEMTVKKGYYIGVKYDPKKNYRTKGVTEL